MKLKSVTQVAVKLMDRDDVTAHTASLRLAKAFRDEQLLKLLQENPELLDVPYGNVPLRKIIVSCITKEVEIAIQGAEGFAG